MLYALRSGKNIKALYFIRENLRCITPRRFHRGYESYLREARSRADYPYIRSRVEYYCKSPGAPLGPDTVPANTIRRRDSSSTYYYDLRAALTPFPADVRINFLPGDITFIPAYPSLTKSRPIEGDNANSVILKLDRIRHFIKPHDVIAFDDKCPTAVFRGKVPGKEKRERSFTCT